MKLLRQVLILSLELVHSSIFPDIRLPYWGLCSVWLVVQNTLSLKKVASCWFSQTVHHPSRQTCSTWQVVQDRPSHSIFNKLNGHSRFSGWNSDSQLLFQSVFPSTVFHIWRITMWVSFVKKLWQSFLLNRYRHVATSFTFSSDYSCKTFFQNALPQWIRILFREYYGTQTTKRNNVRQKQKCSILSIA